MFFMAFLCINRSLDLNCYIRRRIFVCCNTGCSLIIVFFSENFKIFQTLVFLCLPSVSVVVHTHQTGRKPVLQQNWQSFEKSQHFKEKTQYLMNTLYILQMYYQHNINPKIILLRQPEISGQDFISWLCSQNKSAEKRTNISCRVGLAMNTISYVYPRSIELWSKFPILAD